MSRRFVHIDLLRALSILYIVGFWHLFDYTDAFPLYSNQITTRLTVVVLGVFVLMSGYLLGMKDMEFQPRGILEFYRSRLLRIYPLYFVTLVLFYLTQLIDLRTMAKAALLVSMLWGPPPPTLWFIVMILNFFLLAPFLLRLVKNRAALVLACAGATAFLALLRGLLHSDVIDARLPLYLPVFAMGIYLARRKLPLSTENPLLAVGVLLVSILVSASSPEQPELSLASIPLAVFGPLVVLMAAARIAPYIGMSRLITALSSASFLMYLLHRVIYKLMRDVYFPSSGLLQVTYLYLVCLPAIFYLSWCMQGIYDKLVMDRCSSRSPIGIVASSANKHTLVCSGEGHQRSTRNDSGEINR